MNHQPIIGGPAPITAPCYVSKPLGVARMPKNDAWSEPWAIPSGAPLPPLYFRALRKARIYESVKQFTSGAPVKLLDLFPDLMGIRECQQIWLYGISAMQGDPSLPVANANVAYWGWSAGTLFNQIAPYAGTFGQLIQPPDGLIVDSYEIFLAGQARDGIGITAL